MRSIEPILGEAWGIGGGMAPRADAAGAPSIAAYFGLADLVIAHQAALKAEALTSLVTHVLERVGTAMRTARQQPYAATPDPAAEIARASAQVVPTLTRRDETEAYAALAHVPANDMASNLRAPDDRSRRARARQSVSLARSLALDVARVRSRCLSKSRPP